MTAETDITTARDPHQRRHRLILMGLVWLCVYPSVTLCTYLTGGLDLPTWGQTILTTALTVPLITFLVVPKAKAIIARVDPNA